MKTKNLPLAFAAGAIGVTACAALRAIFPGYSFQNKVAVITGGSRGLGFVLARRLASEGARVALLARDEAELARAANDLRKRGVADVFTVRCDVCDEAQVQSAIAAIARHFSAIDILINNAGEIVVGPLSTMTRADFEDAMKLHFWAPLFTTLAALPHMMRSQNKNGDGARIVNISSFGGKLAVPHLAPYCASKFALTGLSDAIRAELARENIRVTTVCPGLMRTGSHLNAFFKGEHRREFAWFSLGAAMPFLSTNADGAARAILSACRRGQPQLVITVPARLAVIAQAIFPNLTAHVLALVNRLLPGAETETAENAREKKRGWESRSTVTPSILTRLADRATEKYNGLRGHASPTAS